MGFVDSVKGFAEKVGGTVDGMGKSVSDKTKKMGEKSKVKTEINKLEAEINNGYHAIGKKYFEINAGSPSGEYAGTINEIKAKLERLDKFKLLLASYEDKQPCANCGAEVSKEQKFCDKCGAKVVFIEPPIIEGFNDAPQAPPPAPNAAVSGVCANCGASLAPNQKFCDKCGTKIM